MYYDIIVEDRETNQLDVVKYFIKINKDKITTIYSDLITEEDKNIELLSNIDSLLNNDFRPIFYILNKDELSKNDIILRDCAIITVEKVTPVYAIPGARRIMEDYDKSLNKNIITNDNKELVYDPIIEDNTIIDENLITNKNTNKARKLVLATQE